VGAHFRMFMASFSVPSACCYPKTRLGGAAGAGASVCLALSMREEREEAGTARTHFRAFVANFSVPLARCYINARLVEARWVLGHPSAWHFE
jgi:hypothetical protein